MTLVIGFSNSCKIGSKIIQWWLGTNYSHVYIKWHLKTQDRDIVYHASNGMVHFMSFDNFLKHSNVVKEISLNLTMEQFKKISSKCIELAGESYSVLELLQIVISDISNNKIKFKDQPGYICSELLCELMEDLGYTFDKPKHLITPKDIFNKFN